MRLIDADALRDKLHELASDDWNQMCRTFWANVYNECADMVDDQPTIEPQKWIPVSERLPKRDEVVLVTYKTTGKIHLCKYLDDTSENAWWSYIDDCYAWNNVVLAWMPLPPAYKEEQNDH